jgi:hypothetical protein
VRGLRKKGRFTLLLHWLPCLQSLQWLSLCQQTPCLLILLRLYGRFLRAYKMLRRSVQLEFCNAETQDLWSLEEISTRSTISRAFLISKLYMIIKFVIWEDKWHLMRPVFCGLSFLVQVKLATATGFSGRRSGNDCRSEQLCSWFYHWAVPI